MTENRLRFDYTAYDDGTEAIYDRKKDKLYFDMQLSNIEELLNELNDENEQLHKENQRLKTQNQRLKEGILWLLEILCKKDPEDDIEFWCQQFFNCNYNTAKEKYGELSKVLWGSNNND